MQIFAQAQALGGEARIVGGAVRDWLANYPVGDIDMAINLPARYNDRGTKRGIRDSRHRRRRVAGIK